MITVVCECIPNTCSAHFFCKYLSTLMRSLLFLVFIQFTHVWNRTGMRSRFYGLLLDRSLRAVLMLLTCRYIPLPERGISRSWFRDGRSPTGDMCNGVQRQRSWGWEEEDRQGGKVVPWMPFSHSCHLFPPGSCEDETWETPGSIGLFSLAAPVLWFEGAMHLPKYHRAFMSR